MGFSLKRAPGAHVFTQILPETVRGDRNRQKRRGSMRWGEGTAERAGAGKQMGGDLTKHSAQSSVGRARGSLYVLQSPQSPQESGTPPVENEGDQGPKTERLTEDERMISEARRGPLYSL